LVSDRDKCCDVSKVVTNFRVPLNAGNLLTSGQPAGFVRTQLLNVICV